MNITLPMTRFLAYPPDGSTIEGGGIVFEWDRRDLQWRSSHSRLIVKELMPGQSAQDAMRVNEVRFETVIEHLGFFAMKAADLKDSSANHVWQVIALDKADGGELTEIAVSEARTFRLASRRINVEKLRSDETVLLGDQREPAELALNRDQSCPNGDLEFGTLQGWQAYYGSRLNSATIYLNNLQSGIINGRHTIRSLADDGDPQLLGFGILLPQVSEGSYAVRLGNSSANGEADVLAYTFTVTQQNKDFSFRYAVVLENPHDHSASQQPFFSYYVLRGSSIFFSSINLPVVSQQVVADSNNPFFKSVGDIVYREWTPTCIDLSAYVGQTMTIVFLTADCSLGGHYGYAYIDGLCRNNDAVASFTMPNEICAGADLWVDGSASSNETSSFWSIEESDANGGRNPATEVYQWFVAQQAGNMNLTSFYATKGGHFKCNTYYRIKLAVSNQCTPWNETVHLLHVKCPLVTAGPDLCVSCTPNGANTQLGIGNPTSPDLTYLWSPTTGLDNPSSPSPFHTQGSVAYPVTYTVKVTDGEGCANSDQVKLYCQPPTVELLVVHHCCHVTLTALAVGYESINWSTGQSGVLSIDVVAGTYTVIVSNPCGSATTSVVVPAFGGLTGFFNPIAANSLFCPPSGSTGCEDKLYIKDVIVGNGAAGVPHAYNATDYQLEIFDRWGNLFRTITDQSCDGFPNWAIAWDGTDQSGNLVQEDTYVWVLHFKNCQFKEWTLPKMRRFADRHCVKWATFFGIKLWCRKYDVPAGTTVDEVLTAGSVSVVR
jgi:hypothetical protein